LIFIDLRAANKKFFISKRKGRKGRKRRKGRKGSKTRKK
jgi:hypothetical protein